MYAFQLIFSIDPSLGRVDYSLMSDQTLMEMLIDGFDDQTKKQYQDKHGMYVDVCEWSCIECDDDERIVQIDIESSRITGSLELCYVPPKVKRFKVNPSWGKGKLKGPVDLARLPEGIEILDLKGNQLTGEIDLKRLPVGLKNLYLSRNGFNGEIDLTQLGEGMNGLHLQNNQLTGEIDLTHLPQGLQRLFLQNNQLTGEIDLKNLPDGMECISLSNNRLSGSLIINELPQGVKMIDVRRNHFNAIAVVDSKTHTNIELRRSGVTSVVDENGKEQDMKRFL